MLSQIQLIAQGAQVFVYTGNSVDKYKEFKLIEQQTLHLSFINQI